MGTRGKGWGQGDTARDGDKGIGIRTSGSGWGQGGIDRDGDKGGPIAMGTRGDR